MDFLILELTSASYQVEGHGMKDGKGVSNWMYFQR